ncbi:MAG: class I SAM-dependent methyltransferase [Treponema sp.]|nr:class I SAM-dependent methyltransferase [Treponema sp.]
MFRPYLSEIDFQSRVLEIGPFTKPNVPKERYKQVYYADIRSTEDVKAFYKAAGWGADPDEIVDIDYVINEHGYADTLRDVEKFDYIVATHVIEHVPQLIAWLQDLSNILKPNGKLCLSIPDKRYTFDHYRYQTTFAECFDVYTRNIKNHPARVLDEVINATKTDPAYWRVNCNDMDALHKDASLFRSAVDLYQKALADHTYMTPLHYSVFTPESFLLILYGMHKLSLLPFRCVEFYDTEENTIEFNCVLLNRPELLEPDTGMMEAEDDNLRRLLKRHQDYYSSPQYLQDQRSHEVFLDIFSEDIARLPE